MAAADGLDALVDRLLADRPAVHRLDLSDTPAVGLLATDPACYRYLASVCRPGARTLETGAGLSTVLFAALGTEHICITPSKDESDRIGAYCEEHNIDLSSVRFIQARSDQALPGLEAEGLDVVLVDGAHGFPLPAVDWFYAGGRLRRGGVVVMDDTNLPAVRLVADYLDADQRWSPQPRGATWAAWMRLHVSDLSEDWWEQPFYRLPLTVAEVPRRAAGRVRRLLARRP
jgi:hypothetical protein